MKLSANAAAKMHPPFDGSLREGEWEYFAVIAANYG